HLRELEAETRHGVQDFVEDNVTELQAKAQKFAKTENGLDENFTCNSCTTDDLTKIKKGQRTTVQPPKQCNNKICNEMKNVFRKDHVYKRPSWGNSDAKKWNTDAIEVAKLFMPPGYKDKDTFEDVDLHGHLNVIVNCKTARDKLKDANIAENAKKFSSRARHMSGDTMTIGDFVDGADIYLKLLNDPAILKYPKAVESVKKIEKIIDDVLGLKIFGDLRKCLHLSRSPMHSTAVSAMINTAFQAKEGLCHFTMNASSELQQNVITEVRKKQKLESDATCDQCSTEDLIPPKPKRGKIEYKPFCPTGYCDSIREFLVDQHAFNTPFWKNTDARKWSTDPWELAKVFMQHGYKDSEGAFVVDFNGLINIIINCKEMSTKLNDPDVASKSREVARKRRHAGHLEVSKDEFKEAVDVYTALLKETGIAKNASAKMALKVMEEASEMLEE
ncbi:hypothetical protein MAR_002924, partial [Mya arenaria]